MPSYHLEGPAMRRRHNDCSAGPADAGGLERKVEPVPHRVGCERSRKAVTTRSRSTAMGNKKIALFMPDLSGGGAERMMINLARGIEGQGAEVDMVLMRKEGPYLPLVPSSVRIVDLGARRTLSSIGPLATYLRRERPAALLSTFVNVNLAALLARRLARVPARVVVREDNYASITHANREALLMRLADRMQPWLYGWADAIIGVSQGVADDMVHNVGVPAERMHVINNPVVTPELHHLASKPVDHPFFSPGQPPVVLGVGRLSAQKDFPTLIRAFAVVRQQRPAKLVILGEGENRPMLERSCDDLGLEGDADLPGFVRNPYAFMARAAVFALSSRWEGSPNVLVEAMACGTPVVATDCPSGPMETLDGGRLGRLVPVGDADALAESIMQTLEMPVAADCLQRRADDFNVERSAEQYLRVLLGDDAV